MGKVYLKTDYDKCDYITAGKLYEATVAQTVKDDGVKYDAYYIRPECGGVTYAIVGAPSIHLDNIGEFVVHQDSRGYVRPAMTPEARDTLNNIHETVGAETRSDSIVEFMRKHTEMEVELCAVKVQLSTLGEQSKRRIEYLEGKAKRKPDCRAVVAKYMKEKSKRKGWMIYSAIVAAYAIGISVYCLIGG